MNQIEASFAAVERFELFTGHKSATAIRLYERVGYKIFKQEPVHDRLVLVFLEKQRRAEGMIRPCTEADFDTIFAIINDAAEAYRNVIPADCWHEPYMSKEYRRAEIDSGVRFWGWDEGGELVGIMGIQDVHDVTLIRHAYVRTASRNGGIGGKLLGELRKLAARPTPQGAVKVHHFARATSLFTGWEGLCQPRDEIAVTLRTEKSADLPPSPPPSKSINSTASVGPKTRLIWTPWFTMARKARPPTPFTSPTSIPSTAGPSAAKRRRQC